MKKKDLVVKLEMSECSEAPADCFRYGSCVQYASRNLVGFRAHHVEIHSKVVGQKRMLNKLQQSVFLGPAYLNYRCWFSPPVHSSIVMTRKNSMFNWSNMEILNKELVVFHKNSAFFGRPRSDSDNFWRSGFFAKGRFFIEGCSCPKNWCRQIRIRFNLDNMFRFNIKGFVSALNAFQVQEMIHWRNGRDSYILLLGFNQTENRLKPPRSTIMGI